jgi:hypothetical protein
VPNEYPRHVVHPFPIFKLSQNCEQ